MLTNVIMPQMGESIFEGTLTKWLKKVGDQVARDEPLFEVSTDKVDSEIPSPANGVLSEIVVPEGQIVKIGGVVAIIEEAKTAVMETPAVTEPVVEPVPEQASEAIVSPQEASPAGEHAPEAEARLIAVEQQAPVVAAEPEAAPVEEAAPAVEVEPAPSEVPEVAPQPAIATEPLPFIHTSPLVRRIARDYDVELSEIEGTGLSGRITKEDVFSHLERAGKKVPRTAPRPPAAALRTEEPRAVVPPLPAAFTPRVPESIPAVAPAGPATAETTAPQQGVPEPAALIEVPKSYGETETVTMTPMRKAIADHMVLSRRTSAHVQTVFEVDMTSIVQVRETHKDEFEARVGFKLSFTPFFVKALVDTVREFPILNCSVSGDKIIFKKTINVGIAVALDTGLIVPVIKDAHLKSFTGLALAIRDLAERARARKLKPEEVQQGTITITNPGIYGSLFGTPIINQPQVSILGVGSLEKRPVIINDAIAIRTMVYLALSFDHRVIDGAVADQCMAALKSRLQSWTQWVE